MTGRYKDRSPAIAVVIVIVFLLSLPVARSAGISRSELLDAVAITAVTVFGLIGLAILDRRPEP